MYRRRYDCVEEGECKQTQQTSEWKAVITCGALFQIHCRRCRSGHFLAGDSYNIDPFVSKRMIIFVYFTMSIHEGVTGRVFLGCWPGSSFKCILPEEEARARQNDELSKRLKDGRRVGRVGRVVAGGALVVVAAKRGSL